MKHLKKLIASRRSSNNKLKDRLLEEDALEEIMEDKDVKDVDPH